MAPPPMVARRQREAVRGSPAIDIAFVMVTRIMALSAAHLLGIAGAAARTGIALALYGCAWFALAPRFVPAIGWPGAIGRRSYEISLWHPLFSATARIVAIELGMHATLVVAGVSFCAAILAPMVAHRAALGWRSTGQLAT